MEKNTKKETKKSSIITGLFFLLSLVVVAVIAIIEFGGKQDRSLVDGDVNVLYLLPAVGCFLLGLLCETIKYYLMLRGKKVKHKLSLGFSCAVIGKYYDNLTPAGAGGQGFQMYHLKKNGCDDGTAGSLPIVGFLGLQFAFVFLGIFTMIFGRGYLSDDLLAIKITAIVGMVFYAFVPVCIIFFAIAPKVLESIVRGITKFLHKIRIIKNIDDAVEKAVGSLRSYSNAIRGFGKDKKLIILLFVISLIYQIGFMSLPFFVLRIFGSSIDFLTCFCRVVYIYAAITIIFTPGNSGAAEASFYMVFSSLSGGAVFWGMLVWRLLCYYSWIICGAIIQVRDGLRNKEIARWHKLPCKKGSAAFFLDTYYPYVDGVVETVHSCASRIDGSYVVCAGTEIGSHPIFNYAVAWVKTLNLKMFDQRLPLPGISFSAKKYIRNHRVSVIHAHSPFPVGWMALRMGKKYKVPVVATFHSKYYDDFYNASHSKLLSKLAVKLVVVPFYEKADVVWACSETTARTLKEYGYTGTVGVMQNGTDMVLPEDHEEIRKVGRTQLRIGEDKKVLVFVGQLIWHKNLKLVLDTFKLIREKGNDYKLLIAGEGYDGKDIREYADSLNLGDSVEFLGRIYDRDEIRKLFLISDLFFFPSKYDNAPLTLREAAALEIPGLLLAGSNSAECITDGVNGFTGPDDPEKMSEIIIDIFEKNLNRRVGREAAKTIPISWHDICKEASEKYAAIAEKY